MRFRLRNTRRLVGVGERSCLGFQYPALSPQAQLENTPTSTSNIWLKRKRTTTTTTKKSLHDSSRYHTVDPPPMHPGNQRKKKMLVLQKRIRGLQRRTIPFHMPPALLLRVVASCHPMCLMHRVNVDVHKVKGGNS